MVSVDDIGPDWLLISWSVYDEIMTSITLAYIVWSHQTVHVLIPLLYILRL